MMPLPVYLQRLSVQDLSQEDLARLLSWDRLGYDGVTAQEHLDMIANGAAVCWRIAGACEGLLLTIQHKDCLWVEGIGGKGLLACAKPLIEAIRTEAEKLGTPTIRAASRMRKLFKRLGFTPVATVVEI